MDLNDSTKQALDPIATKLAHDVRRLLDASDWIDDIDDTLAGDVDGYSDAIVSEDGRLLDSAYGLQDDALGYVHRQVAQLLSGDFPSLFSVA